MNKKYSDKMDLPFIGAELLVRVTRKIIWNSFPGSVVHGVLGMKLKERSCVVVHRNCSKCFLVHSCQFGTIYESKMPGGSERMKLYPQTPHPIRTAVFPWDKPIAEKDSEFRIQLYLYGTAVMSSLSCLMAIDDALDGGVGRKYGGARGTAEILSVKDVVSGDLSNWGELKNKFQSPVKVSMIEEIISKKPITNLFVRLESPTKLNVGGRISFTPTIRDILAALLRRIGNLQYFYNRTELELPYKEILDVAENLNIQSDLTGVKAMRYSSRQGKTLSVSGVVGRISVIECPESISRILQVGQYLGVGKNTTMGLGSYKVEAMH